MGENEKTRQRGRYPRLAPQKGIPARYLKNIGTLGRRGQERMLNACVAVVGLGGLGGHAVELLARVGVGALILADPDKWTEDNLNRQILCTERTIGMRKIDTAAARVRAVNRGVKTAIFFGRITRKNAAKIFGGADIIVDATDGVRTRLELQDASALLGVPLVSAAIAGWTGIVTTIFPGDLGWRSIYGASRPPIKGLETRLGNPTPTPSIAAALEVVEVIKLAAGVGGEPLRNKFMFFDLAACSFSTVKIKSPRPRKKKR